MIRSEIKEEDKWDLTKYYKDETEYDKESKKALNLVKKIVSMKGSLAKDADTLYNFLELDDELSLLHERLYVYSYLYHYSDQTDEYGKKLKDKADRLDEKIGNSLSFVSSEILQTPYKEIKKFIKEDERLKKYAFALENMYRYEEHTLSSAEEAILAQASNAMGTGDEAFSALDNEDSKFGSVVIDGESVEITHSNFIKLMNNKDQKVRKEVFETYYKYFDDRKNTIAELYKGQVKEDMFYSKVRKYDSPLQMSLYSDAIDVEVYKNLIKTLHENIKPLYDYMAFRKNFLKLDELHMYDIYVDLVKDGFEARTFTFEEAREYVLNAVKPLGDKYVKDLTRLFDSRCIDKLPNDGKRSGAYQWGSYGVDPYVSINFEGTEDSVSTLAHELGHAMHSYYSDTTQNHVYAQYPIFLAEIASTVNEVLLNEYMIEKATSKEEKLLYITSFLDKFRATVYRQTQFAEFEMKIHDMEQNEESITTDNLAQTYMDINKFYYGNDVVSDDLIKYEWSRIPHFYTPFYVYKYATGFCAAMAIASDILNKVPGAQENYLKFLSSGGSDYPLNTLKRCGVDMTTSEPIIKGIKMFEEKIKMAKEIVAEGDK